MSFRDTPPDPIADAAVQLHLTSPIRTRIYTLFGSTAPAL